MSIVSKGNARSIILFTLWTEVACMSYIEFDQLPKEPRRRTFRWVIREKRNRQAIGLIYWHSPWRKYVFSPAGHNIIFDHGCLTEITQFIFDAMQARKS